MSILDVILEVLLGPKMHKMRLQRQDFAWDLLQRVCEANTAKPRNWLKTMVYAGFWTPNPTKNVKVVKKRAHQNPDTSAVVHKK